MNETAIKILEAIDNSRPPPTIREIAQTLDTNSTSVVSRWLGILESEGLISRRKNIARSAYLTAKGFTVLEHPDEYNIDGPTFSGPRSLYLPWEDALIRRHAEHGHRIEQAVAALNTHPYAEDRATKRDTRSVRYRAGVLGVTFKNENTRSIDNVSDS